MVYNKIGGKKLAKDIVVLPEKNLGKVKELVEKKHQVAATIGLFVAPIRVTGDRVEVLVRRRTAKDSLYDVDLSGKNEAIGGAQSYKDLTNGYFASIIGTLCREAMEEAGLDLSNWNPGFPLVMLPAQLSKEDGMNDFAFIVPMKWSDDYGTQVYSNKLASGAVNWYGEDDLTNLNKPVVSLRTRVLLLQAIEYVHMVEAKYPS
jgi:8-oxo-dGTP pyrophosphatase MutT (NUDIX family)